MSARISANNFADLRTQMTTATPEQLTATQAYWAALPGVIAATARHLIDEEIEVRQAVAHDIETAHAALVTAMAPTTVKTVSDLTDEHIGWEIRVPDDGAYPWRTLAVSGLRKWVFEGRERVGILDTSEARPGIRGTEYSRDGDTPCKLLRQVAKPRRRRGGKR